MLQASKALSSIPGVQFITKLSAGRAPRQTPAQEDEPIEIGIIEAPSNSSLSSRRNTSMESIKSESTHPSPIRNTSTVTESLERRSDLVGNLLFFALSFFDLIMQYNYLQYGLSI